MSRAQEWATRLAHELSEHPLSSFLTLTYNNEHYPDDGSVAVRPLQLFMKRLRKRVAQPVRFFACGEYGSEMARPHYHVLLFGFDFPDRYLWRKTKTGYITFRSPFLEELWPYGHSEIGSVTLESAGYVSKYILKKVYGRGADDFYKRIHPLTGEIVQLKPEFIVMSQGIGRAWFDRFSSDAFPSDFVVVNGKKRPVPRYYTKKLQIIDEALHDEIKGLRKAKAELHAANNTPERLSVREEVLERKLDRFQRDE